MLHCIKLWIYAARPKTLFIGAAPIIFGSLLAFKHSTFDLQTFILCLLGSLLIQIGTNYSNDYYDFLNKADTSLRKGNIKVLEQGLLSLGSMKNAFIACFFLAGAVAISLLQRGGLPILAIACVCIVFSISYTAPPFPLAYLGLGDLFVVVFYGPIATLTCFYLHAHFLTLENAFIGVIPGVLGLGPLIMNNIRDLDQDRIANKKTLIVRWGDVFGKYYFFSILGLGMVLPYVHSLLFDKNPFVFLTTLAYVPVLKNLPLLSNFTDRQQLHQLFIASAKIVPLYTLLYVLSELLFYVTRPLFL